MASVKVSDATRLYMEYRETLDRATATFRNDRTTLNHFEKEVSGGLWLNSVKRDHLLKIIYSGGRSTETRRKIFKGLNQFFKWSIKRKYMEYNPLDELEMPRTKPCDWKPPYALSDEEINTVCSMLKSEYIDLFLFFILTGRRSGEIVDNEHENHIPPAWLMTSGEIRFWLQKVNKYSYTPVKNQILGDIVNRNNEQGIIKFNSPSGDGYIKYREFYAQLNCIKSLTGIPVHPHVCRSTYITRAINEGLKAGDAAIWYKVADTLSVSVEILKRHYRHLDVETRRHNAPDVSYVIDSKFIGMAAAG